MDHGSFDEVVKSKRKTTIVFCKTAKVATSSLEVSPFDLRTSGTTQNNSVKKKKDLVDGDETKS